MEKRDLIDKLEKAQSMLNEKIYLIKNDKISLDDLTSLKNSLGVFSQRDDWNLACDSSCKDSIFANDSFTAQK